MRGNLVIGGNYLPIKVTYHVNSKIVNLDNPFEFMEKVLKVFLIPNT